MKNIKALLSLVIGIIFSSMAFAAESGGTITVCPGVGVSCVVKAPEGTVTSEKDKDKAAVVIVQK